MPLDKTNNIFDQIDQRVKTWQYQKGAEVTSRIMLYNSRHPNKVIDVDKIAKLSGLDEKTIKQILAGAWKDRHEYQIVQEQLNQLLKEG